MTTVIKWSRTKKDIENSGFRPCRCWPVARYYNGALAAWLACDDPYDKYKAKRGSHLPLTMWIADYSTGILQWRRCEMLFKSVEVAKRGLQVVLTKNPELMPK